MTVAAAESDVVDIGGHLVGRGRPTFIIAELSANHGGSLDRALEIVRAAAAAGADAVKMQTYTADTMTIDSSAPDFTIGRGTLWEGRTLYDLYAEAATPWEWYRPLSEEVQRHGMVLFSTPFDLTAVDYLEQFDPPAFKIASFELTDLTLIRHAAGKGRPLVMSTGMASLEEIDSAVDAASGAGDGGLVLLRCNSAYPSDVAEMDLRTIEDMRERWHLPVGLSDHTLDDVAVTVSIALGAAVVEKHLTISRGEPGPDSAFSLEPPEFARMVAAVRKVEAGLGQIRYGPSESEEPSLAFRRSVFAVEDIAAGEEFTRENIRVIRPAAGLPPDSYEALLGRRAVAGISRGTPLAWDLVE